MSLAELPSGRVCDTGLPIGEKVDQADDYAVWVLGETSINALVDGTNYYLAAIRSRHNRCAFYFLSAAPQLAMSDGWPAAGLYDPFEAEMIAFGQQLEGECLRREGRFAGRYGDCGDLAFRYLYANTVKLRYYVFRNGELTEENSLFFEDQIITRTRETR